MSGCCLDRHTLAFLKALATSCTYWSFQHDTPLSWQFSPLPSRTLHIQLFLRRWICDVHLCTAGTVLLCSLVVLVPWNTGGLWARPAEEYQEPLLESRGSTAGMLAEMPLASDDALKADQVYPPCLTLQSVLFTYRAMHSKSLVLKMSNA